LVLIPIFISSVNRDTRVANLGRPFVTRAMTRGRKSTATPVHVAYSPLVRSSYPATRTRATGTRRQSAARWSARSARPPRWTDGSWCTARPFPGRLDGAVGVRATPWPFGAFGPGLPERRGV